MLGALLGDIVGSVHEHARTQSKAFPLFVARSEFTDDSVLTAAVAEWLLTGEDLTRLVRSWVAAYPGRGYGGMFSAWAHGKREGPYGSFGNGAAMRVSPVGFAFGTLEEVLAWAERSAAVTHDHPEGIRGAQATATAVWLARQGRTKDDIRREVETRFGYDLGTPLDAIRPSYRFDETCQGTVPQALRSFLESTGVEDAIRNAISLGGDADTLACIAGGVAEAFYGGVPADLAAEARRRLDPRILGVLDRFRERHRLP